MSEVKYTVGVLVVSDSCAAKQATDTSGVHLTELLAKDYEVVAYHIVPDDVDQIKNILVEWSDEMKLSLILTTGGTGLAPTDVTPEATKLVIQKEVHSIANVILMESFKITKFAILSRAISGIRGRTLIINLPGSKKGASECIGIVLPMLKHALNLVNEDRLKVKSEHASIQKTGTVAIESSAEQDSEILKSKVTTEDILLKPRKSVYPMVSVDEALKMIIDNSDFLQNEEIFYLDALNRISAEDIHAVDPLPPFNASVKDGFALRLPTNYEKNDNLILSVVGSSNAGDNLNVNLKQGECVKINTGAFVPSSAEAVIQIEDTVSLAQNVLGEDASIAVPESNIKVGQDIRPVGFDIQANETVVLKHAQINAAQLGICATVGALNIKVYTQPVVALISTGNELLSPDCRTLEPGKIRDSNKSLLFGSCKQIGIEKVVDGGVANDNPDSVLNTFKNALDKADVVISTGGVSMGDKDLVKDVLLKDLDCTIHFGRMNMKPGKPTTFATCMYKGKKKLLFCLPGNPVSAIVTFNLVVVPSIRKLMGYENPFHTKIKVRLGFDAEIDPRPEYHRGIIKWNETDNTDGYPNVYSTGNQHSSRLLSMNQANCLLELPATTSTRTFLKKGEIVTALYIEKL